MSDTTLIAILFAASAPIALMPALVGLITRHERRALILIANLVLWGVGYVSVKSFVTSTSGAFLPVPIAILCWVGLFVYVIRPRRARLVAPNRRWTEGGLYVVPQEEGAFTALKILKVDDHGVHVRTYSNLYAEPPAQIDESTLFMAGVDEGGPMGIGHLPLLSATFAAWGPRFVQWSTVVTDELEGYEMWHDADGGYF